MERILSEDEKIKRAEEIYLRRNNMMPIRRTNSTNNKGNFKNKLLLNLLLMINLVIIVFVVQNKDYIFATEFLSEIDKYTASIGVQIKEFLKSEKLDNSNENINTSGSDAVISESNNEEISKEENIKEEITEEKSSSISEMEIDANNIKSSYSLTKPLLSYIVSSGFGARESEYQNVTGYHTGIDLAAEKGTTINASMEGIVELVSSEGDYGKHIKIRCNNITTLYAHCSSIFVQEGQIVRQGQPIGAVGSTGNSTGSHLHFEIRVDDRYVDPSKIIDF